MSGTQKQINIATLSGSDNSISFPATGALSNLVTLNFILPATRRTTYTFSATSGNPNLTLASHGIAEGTKLTVEYSSYYDSFSDSSSTSFFIYQAINVTPNTIQLRPLHGDVIAPVNVSTSSGNVVVNIFSSGAWSYCQANTGTEPYQVPEEKKLIILTNPTSTLTFQLGYSDDFAPVATRRTTTPLNETLLTPEWPVSAVSGTSLATYCIGATIPGGKYVFVKFPYGEVRGTFFGILVDAV